MLNDYQRVQPHEANISYVRDIHENAEKNHNHKYYNPYESGVVIKHK